jgi:hypothetical protein
MTAASTPVETGPSSRVSATIASTVSNVGFGGRYCVYVKWPLSRSTSAVVRDGAAAATWHATAPPHELPITAARSMPRASSMASHSRASSGNR